MKHNRKRKQIAVIGLGQFGGQIARDLAKHAEVLAIDQSKPRVDSIADQVQRAVCMNARDLASLKAVVTADFDEAIVSMGESLEASVLCTLHLKQIGIETIRVKATNEDHASILTAVGATDVVFPERDTATRVAAQILNPNLIDFFPIEQDYRVMDLTAPVFTHGKTLIELNLRKRFGVFIIAVKQSDQGTFLFMPEPEYTIRPEDVLVVIGKEDDIFKLGEQDPPKE